MAKGTIIVDVEARTNKATTSIKKLQSDLQNSSKFNLSSLTGISKEFGASGGIGAEINSATGMLTKFTSILSNPAVGAAGLIGTTIKGFSDMAERGQQAAQAAEKMNVKLGTIMKNFGNSGAGVQAITRELQLLAANGVNPIESIQSATEILTVAFKGDAYAAADLVKKFDDLAAGTGIQIDDWASMAAEVMNTGVSIKDLTRLSNRGLPIFQALGDAMGVTADQAEQMAKKGMVSTQEWMDAVSNLANSYKGVSEAMSSQTLSGAQSTYDASRSLEMQGAAEARNAQMIDALNGLSNQMQESLNDPQRQAELQMAGNLAGKIDVLTMQIKEAVNDFPQTLANFAIKLGTFETNLLGIGNNSMSRAQYWANGLNFMPNLVNDEASIEMFREGKTSVDIKGFIKQFEQGIEQLTHGLNDDKYSEEEKETFRQRRSEMQEQLNALNTAFELTKAEEDQKKAAEEAAAAEEKLAQEGKNAADALSKLNQQKAMQSNDPDKMMAAVLGVDKLQDGYTARDYIEQGLSALEGLIQSGGGTMEDFQKLQGYYKVKEAIDKQDAEAAKKREAEEAEAKRRADTIAGKIESAQKNYDTVTKRLEEQQAIRSQIADEEAHGIYRKKWGNLAVSDVSTKEAELLKEQAEADKKLKELKDSYSGSLSDVGIDGVESKEEKVIAEHAKANAKSSTEIKNSLEDYFKSWETTRGQIDRFFTSVVAGNVVPVKGVPITG